MALGSGQGDAIDPVSGRESGHCQPLIRMTIRQETTERLILKIERSSQRCSGPPEATADWPRLLRGPEAATGGEDRRQAQRCVSPLHHLTSDPQSLIDTFPLRLEPQISEVDAG